MRVATPLVLTALLAIAGCSGGSSGGGATAAGLSTASTTTGSTTTPPPPPPPPPPPAPTALPLPSGPTGGPRARGIDVSYYQGVIDWAAVKNAGIDFAIVRVSDGTGFRDPQFARNWRESKANGLVRGVYQFFRPTQDPVAQADLLLAELDALGGIQPGDLPPVCDLEVRDGRSAAQVVAAMDAWIARVVARTGIKPLIYTSPSFWNALAAPSHEEDNGLWIAHWGVNAPTVANGWLEWTFWQTSATGRVAGISGDVDTNLFNGSVDDLRAYAAASPSNAHQRGLAVNSTGRGYWTVGQSGGVLAFGDASFRGTAGGRTHPQPAVSMLRTPTGLGYWVLRADGAVLRFGDAVRPADLAGQTLTAPIGAMAATATGQGYWLFGRDGRVYPFGDAQAKGEPAGSVTSEVVAAASTPSGQGYWTLTADGAVQAFGDASALGDLAGQALGGPATGIAATPSGRGYWIVLADRTVASFGDAPTLTYQGPRTTSAPILSIASTLTGQGYWLLAGDGTVFPVGDAVDGGRRAR